MALVTTDLFEYTFFVGLLLRSKNKHSSIEIYIDIRIASPIEKQSALFF